MAAALCLQLWRSWRLEQQLRDAERERARLLAERILQRVAGSPSLPPAALAATTRRTGFELREFEVRGGRVVVDPRVAWLELLDDAVDDDPVVSDRLDRAARSEFVARDVDRAVAEYDALLDGALQAPQRLQVLAAACWHARRAELEEREAALRADLREQLAGVRPADLHSPRTAAAVASAQRLGGGLLAPARRAALLPFLPPTVFAGLDVDVELRQRHDEAVTRRAQLRAAQAHLDGLDGQASAGLHALAEDRLLWCGPVADGVRRALICSPRQWLALVRRLGADDSLLLWPERVEPVFGPVGEVRLAGVPGLRRLEHTGPAGSPGWFVPALATLLIVAFGLAFAQLRRAARRERAAMAAQARFLTTVTHELKTPLAGIRLLGEMLAEGRARGREADYYRLLVAESARLSTLIENVLDLGRLERGERRYTLRPTAVGDAVRETLEMLAPLLEQDGVAVAFDDGAGGVEVEVDRDAFVQALVIVLDNARKYGATGGRVELRSLAAGRTVELAVRDHGPGVPEAERERIFERFVRGDAHRHGSTPGVGIGLYLARSIVRRLGGTLVCRPPQGGGDGAEFVFTLMRPEAPRSESP